MRRLQGRGGFQICGERTEKSSILIFSKPAGGSGHDIYDGTECLHWDSHIHVSNHSMAKSFPATDLENQLRKNFMDNYPGENSAPYQGADVFSIWVMGVLDSDDKAEIDFGVRDGAHGGMWKCYEEVHHDKPNAVEPADIPVPEDRV